MVKTVDVVQQIRDTLDSNLEDPNKNRTTEWVFANEVPETHSQFPRIIVEVQDAQKNGFSIGSTQRFHRQRIQASIQVDKTNKWDVNNDGIPEPSQYVKLWLAERCDKIIQDNQADFRNLGTEIHSVLPDSSNPIAPKGVNQVNNDYILRRNKA